jgi:hybrid cluster-associated redox disulfide protein
MHTENKEHHHEHSSQPGCCKTNPEKKCACKPSEEFTVTRDTLIGDAAREVPDAAEIMFSYGLACFGCGMTAYETIEQGCSGHGMEDEEIDNLVAELNESLERARKEIQHLVGDAN